MISGYRADRDRLKRVGDVTAELGDVIWIDLVRPGEDEASLVEKGLGIDIPTREEMREIEASSRVYREDHAAFMTAILPARSDTDDPEMAPVTFVLARGRLVTVRYHEPGSFPTFVKRAGRSGGAAGSSGEEVLISLLEVVIDRLADVVERVAGDVDSISRDIFGRGAAGPARSPDSQRILEAIGRKGHLVAKLRESLATLDRVGVFLTQVTTSGALDAGGRARLVALNRDVRSLTDHLEFVSQNVSFLLNATLGMINIEQNAIIKIFSIAAVVFLPPTLIASIYGMNFERMPELHWASGYPLALALMIVSAVVPLWLFKRRGWL